jgi:hypothetical protein
MVLTQLMAQYSPKWEIGQVEAMALMEMRVMTVERSYCKIYKIKLDYGTIRRIIPASG